MAKKKVIRMPKGMTKKDPLDALTDSVEDTFERIEAAEQPAAMFAACLCDSHDDSESRIVGSRGWMPQDLFERLQTVVDATVVLWVAEGKPASAKLTVVN
jgi:hypothetical protein